MTSASLNSAQDVPQPSAGRARPWIKICGNTSVEDALLGAELGADALGFIFAPSPRRVEPEQARDIVRELPSHVERVGVFAGSTPEEIARIVEQASLSAVQLHGGPASGSDLTLLRNLLPRGTRLLHTLHFAVGEDVASSAAQVARQLRELVRREGSQATLDAAVASGLRVLVDAKVGGVSGGLGVPFDWQAARPVFASGCSRGESTGPCLILAGGLEPGNVAEAIETLMPWGVDVVSGVEKAPGRKDEAKLRAFFRNARSGTLPSAS